MYDAIVISRGTQTGDVLHHLPVICALPNGTTER